MNIIIVAKPGARSDFTESSVLARARQIGCIVGSCALLLSAAIGFAAALIVANPRDQRPERGEVDARPDRHAAEDDRQSRNRLAPRLDALALQLGALQAQATRLNALGQRLTQIGKLDDGEFDFERTAGDGRPGRSDAPCRTH